MGLFGRKQQSEPNEKPYYVPPHRCEDNVLLDQEGDYVVHWCGRCDRVLRREKDVPPPMHG